MHDLVIRNGLVVDGTGAEPRKADIAIDNGLITEVGNVAAGGKREIDATGHVVTPGWVDEDAFLAGYGAAQAVPGPLFTFAAFLGAASLVGPGGWTGAAIALMAIFLPSFLLVTGVFPFWDRLRADARMCAALAGVNAAVVGLLLAALYTPVWTGAIRSTQDLVLGLVAFVALMFWKLPPWFVVAACVVVGWAIGPPS